jgi:hypothetical protein
MKMEIILEGLFHLTFRVQRHLTVRCFGGAVLLLVGTLVIPFAFALGFAFGGARARSAVVVVVAALAVALPYHEQVLAAFPGAHPLSVAVALRIGREFLRWRK